AVDCADMGIAAGEHRLFPATEARLACKARGLSTHGIGLADGLALAEALGRRGETWVFGVQPADTDLRDGLSPVLSHRLPALAAALADAVRQLTETTISDVTG
ncbi:MAG: hypothetical protein PHQ14_14340, partial [Chromatiales bacterium]|nr:hypothetical protein [Chromatiales bacterium]